MTNARQVLRGIPWAGPLLLIFAAETLADDARQLVRGKSTVVDPPPEGRAASPR